MTVVRGYLNFLRIESRQGAARPLMGLTLSAMEIRPFQRSDEDAVINLWRRCDLVRPQNAPPKDIARKLAVQPDMFLLALKNGAIIGSVMYGCEGHRCWIDYLAVDPPHRREGIARELWDAAERALLAACCREINLEESVVDEPEPDSARIPPSLSFIIEPAKRYGHIQFEEEIEKFEATASDAEKAELRKLAHRLWEERRAEDGLACTIGCRSKT